MSTRLTRITEITTGLGMLPDCDLDSVFDRLLPPEQLDGVDAETWQALQAYRNDDADADVFAASFAAGRHFLRSAEALRGRPPRLVEWRGPHRLPERDPLPADLRIDHVYVVSCKNLSKVLRNPSPVLLFREARCDGAAGARGDWYDEIAPDEYRTLYRTTVDALGLPGMPDTPGRLTREQKDALRDALRTGWPDGVGDEAQTFTTAVSQRSASALRAAAPDAAARERLYWQFLRLHSSSYFILGNQRNGPTHLRVLTPWDFRRRFAFGDMEITAADGGQPQVNWSATFRDLATGVDRVVHGHVEIRWSHGKFNGAPEAKIYLDTPHADAPGYEPF